MAELDVTEQEKQISPTLKVFCVQAIAGVLGEPIIELVFQH